MRPVSGMWYVHDVHVHAQRNPEIGNGGLGGGGGGGGGGPGPGPAAGPSPSKIPKNSPPNSQLLPRVASIDAASPLALTLLQQGSSLYLISYICGIA
jgi:hypothetical protein